MRNYVIIICSIFLFISCITPLDINTQEFEKVLVIESHLTTEIGPHKVRITESAKYGSIFDGSIEFVNDATVFIRDSEGNAEVLKTVGNGYYETSPEYRGEVGLGYTLTVEREGITYNSTQEFIEKINTLDSLYTNFNRYPILTENDDIVYQTGVDVYTSYTKEPGTSNYYLWDYNGVFYIRTYPEFYTEYTRGGPVSAPKDCCSDCYRTEFNDRILISTYPVGLDHQDLKLLFLEDDGYRFYNKYVMELKRYSLSLEAYQFYNLIKQQLEINGDIFDPPPVTIRGNIINTENAEDLVVGYFTVSDVEIDTFTINRGDLETVVNLPVYPDDCRVIPNTSTLPPDIWQ